MNTKSNKVYVDAVIKSLEMKKELLEDVVKINGKQQEFLLKPEFDYEGFDALMEEKQGILNKIDQLEQVFESNYERVKEELATERDIYANELGTMQTIIRQMTELSIKIRGSETQIKQGVEAAFAKARQKVKQYHVSSRTASQYYKNMANQHMGQSYFLDKKK